MIYCVVIKLSIAFYIFIFCFVFTPVLYCNWLLQRDKNNELKECNSIIINVATIIVF